MCDMENARVHVHVRSTRFIFSEIIVERRHLQHILPGRLALAQKFWPVDTHAGRFQSNVAKLPTPSPNVVCLCCILYAKVKLSPDRELNSPSSPPSLPPQHRRALRTSRSLSALWHTYCCHMILLTLSLSLLSSYASLLPSSLLFRCRRSPEGRAREGSLQIAARMLLLLAPSVLDFLPPFKHQRLKTVV